MSKCDTTLLLEDMLQPAQKIKRYTRDLDYDAFLADDKTIDAVVRNFEIIREAANRIDSKFKEADTGIELNRILGFRNRIIHEYFRIDYEIVWTIIESYLEEIIDWIETLLGNDKDR